MIAPFSSYSCLENHICWNDPRDPKIDPPTQELAQNSVEEPDCDEDTLTLRF